jgi:hypothetical protein
MRPMTSSVYQRLMAEAWAAGPPPPRSTPTRESARDMGRLLLNYVLSDPYVDVALVGGHVPCLSEPRFVPTCQALAPEISDDVASRIDLTKLHDRYVI